MSFFEEILASWSNPDKEKRPPKRTTSKPRGKIIKRASKEASDEVCSVEDWCKRDLRKLKQEVKVPKNLQDLVASWIPFRTRAVRATPQEKKFYLQLVKKVSQEEWVPEISIIKMIEKENGWWDPLYKVWLKWQSAFWLGQHTHEIRQLYKDRISPSYRFDNPEDQIRITALYLRDMCRNYSCWGNWDLARALYHVWTGIFRTKPETVKYYASLNKWVWAKIPKDKKLNGVVYFIWALAYYSWKTYEQARQIVIDSRWFRSRFWIKNV